MSARTVPPFRADHVGSLLRPASLVAARGEHAAGRLSAEQLRAAEDTAIAGAVAMQQRAGLQSATDGEFRRATWHMDFIYQIGGISKAPGNLAVKFHNPAGDIEWTPAALHVGSKLHMDKTIFGDDFQLPAVGGRPVGGQADDPVAEHGALPGWPGVDRSGGVPRYRGVLGGSGGGVCR